MVLCVVTAVLLTVLSVATASTTFEIYEYAEKSFLMRVPISGSHIWDSEPFYIII